MSNNSVLYAIVDINVILQIYKRRNIKYVKGVDSNMREGSCSMGSMSLNMTATTQAQLVYILYYFAFSSGFLFSFVYGKQN